MALFYAASEQGDHKAANAARTAAYTEKKQPEAKKAKSSDDIPDFFGNALKRFEDDNSRTTNQTFFASPKRTKVNSGQQEIAENEKEKSKTGNTKVLDAVKNSSTIRYAGEDKIRFYTDATIKSENVDLISLGDKVIYLGEKKKTDNTEWAKVSYNGKTGWVKSEYLKTQKSAVKGDIFAYLTNELTDNDIKAGLKVVEKGNEFYYDYTDVIMNQINKVLPDFYENDVLTYQEYTEKYAKKYDNELLSEHYVYYPAHTEYQAYVLKRLLYFTSQVTHGTPWDIKVDSSWQTQFGDVRMPYYDGTEKNDELFLFRGELVTREDLGNITYGYLGSAMGLGEKTLYWGAGVANNWKEGIIKGKAYVYDAEKPYGDTPEDHNFVKRGIELYYEDYPEAKPGINRTIP